MAYEAGRPIGAAGSPPTYKSKENLNTAGVSEDEPKKKPKKCSIRLVATYVVSLVIVFGFSGAIIWSMKRISRLEETLASVMKEKDRFIPQNAELTERNGRLTEKLQLLTIQLQNDRENYIKDKNSCEKTEHRLTAQMAGLQSELENARGDAECLKKTATAPSEQLSKIRNDQFKKNRIDVSNDHLYAVKIVGNMIYTAGRDRKLYAIDLNANSQRTKTYKSGHTESISCIDATEHLLVTGSYDNTVRIWRRTDMELLHELTDHTADVRECKITGDLLITGAEDNNAIVYTLTDQGPPTKTHVLKDHTNTVRAIDINADYIATASYDKTVNIWDRRTGDLHKTMGGHSDWVLSVKFLDATHAASTSWDKNLIIWDVFSGTAVKTLDNGDYGYMAVHNDLIYTARRNTKEVLVWDYTAGADSMPERPVKVIKTEHTDYIWAIDATDTKIVTASDDGHITVIEIDA